MSLPPKTRFTTPKTHTPPLTCVTPKTPRVASLFSQNRPCREYFTHFTPVFNTKNPILNPQTQGLNLSISVTHGTFVTFSRPITKLPNYQIPFPFSKLLPCDILSPLVPGSQ